MIIKAIFYFVVLFGFAFFAVQGVQNTGIITIDWFGYTVEINAMFAVFMVLLFVFLVQIMMHILTVLGILPSVFKYKKEAKKLRTGLEKLKAVSLQLSLGNKIAAKKIAEKANKLIPQYPIFDDILNLKSKADYSNDVIDLKLAKNKADEFLKNYNEEKALKIIENILQEHPKSSWARQRQYYILLKLEEFDMASNILDLMLKEKLIKKAQYKTEKSFIYYELAVLESDYLQALKFAEKGMKQNHNFFKLIEISAMTLVGGTEEEKALKLILSTAKHFNEAYLPLQIFKHVIDKFEKEEQIKWLDKFAKIDKSLIGCQIAKANSLNLQDKKDEAIAFLTSCNPSKEILTMLSHLFKTTGDNEKALDFLEKSQNFKPLNIDGMLKEYKQWQDNIFAFDNDENNIYIEQVNEDETASVLLENEIKQI